MDYSLGEYIARNIVDSSDNDFAVKVRRSYYNHLPAGYHIKKSLINKSKPYFKSPAVGEVVDIEDNLRALEKLKSRGLVSEQVYNRSKKYLYDRDDITQGLDHGFVKLPDLLSGGRIIDKYDYDTKSFRKLSKLDKSYIKDVKTINKLDKRMSH